MAIKLVVCENYADMSARCASMFAEQIQKKPNAVLGLATGSTPIGTYEVLCKMYQEGALDFSKIRTYNLDEYYPISPDNDQSYRFFMQKNLFEKVNIDPKNTHVPCGSCANPEEECARYDKAIEEAGGIDLQLLGIGVNGHIAFNEPDEALIVNTHVTALTESTIQANARFFACAKEVPRHALTMGIGSILRARKIILLASGANKHEAVTALLSGKISTNCPASMLNLHADTILLCDRAAYNG